jgi:hypothetical protein
MQPTMSPSEFIYQRPFDFALPVTERQLSASSGMHHNVHGSETTGERTVASNPEQHTDHGRTTPGYRTTTTTSGVHSDGHQPRIFGGDPQSLNTPPFQMSDMPFRGISFRKADFTQHMAPIALGNNVDSASHPSQQAHAFPAQEALPSYHEDRRRSATLSTTDSTISRTISIYSTYSEHAHRLCAAVGATHDICLQATKAYLSSHHANHQARACGASDMPSHASPSRETDAENKRSAPEAGPASAGQAPRVYRSGIPDASDSLLQNISGICNMLWMGSQRDRLLVLGVERIAVDNMARLLAWGETVALGDYDEWTLAEENALGRVLDAGRSLCAWLGVQESMRDMKTLETQLRG